MELELELRQEIGPIAMLRFDGDISARPVCPGDLSLLSLISMKRLKYL